jgi:hypothetical protein
MQFPSSNKVFHVYQMLSPAVVLIAFSSGFVSSQKTRFKEIEAERINIVEPNGQIRLVISNKQNSPGVMEKGALITQNGGRPGMLFYNDEGTENGGLTFSGGKVNGVVDAASGLTLDQYEQDQAIALQYVENNGHRRAGLAITDWPSTVSTKQLLQRSDEVSRMAEGPEKAAARAALRELRGRIRLYAGRSRDDGASVVNLYDAAGRPRLRLKVDSAGDPRVEFLNDSGRVTLRIPERPAN